MLAVFLHLVSTSLLLPASGDIGGTPASNNEKECDSYDEELKGSGTFSGGGGGGCEGPAARLAGGRPGILVAGGRYPPTRVSLSMRASLEAGRGGRSWQFSVSGSRLTRYEIRDAEFLVSSLKAAEYGSRITGHKSGTQRFYAGRAGRKECGVRCTPYACLTLHASRNTHPARRDARYQMRDPCGVHRERRNPVIRGRICAGRGAGFGPKRATPFCALVVTLQKFLL